MTDCVGTTSNGLDCTAQYELAVMSSVIWAATFRKNGIYRGMRHGRVFAIGELSGPDLRLAVMDDIEETWIGVH